MELLSVYFKDREELLTMWNKLGELIKEGYWKGTLMDGWDIEEVKE